MVVVWNMGYSINILMSMCIRLMMFLRQNWNGSLNLSWIKELWMLLDYILMALSKGNNYMAQL